MKFIHNFFYVAWTVLIGETTFSLSQAPEIFQHWLGVALENLLGIYIIFDDILIHEEGDSVVESERDHNR